MPVVMAIGMSEHLGRAVGMKAKDDGGGDGESDGDDKRHDRHSRKYMVVTWRLGLWRGYHSLILSMV